MCEILSFRNKRDNWNKALYGIREIADVVNQAELSQFKLTPYLIPGKFSRIQIMNLKL